MTIVFVALYSFVCSILLGVETRPIATFSIVARDLQTKEMGVAVQSKFIAVGSVVPHGHAGVGVIATQAFANPLYGSIGLDLLISGKSANEALSLLIEVDPLRERRQAAILGIEGNASVHTGIGCLDWAGSRTGKNHAVLGNLLVGPHVVEEMSLEFEKAQGTLAERMISSLHAGQKAGGDRRGRQSAALLIVRKGWGYGGLTDRFRDLRVDDHEKPIEELERIYQLHRKIFPRPNWIDHNVTEPP